MIQLYYSPGNASLAPHMVLRELGVAHALVLVDTEHKEHQAPAYLKLNPSGRIPVMTDGDLVLFETAAICLHLADTHLEGGLVPPVGSAQRAHLYKWLMYLTNTVQAEMISYFYPERISLDEAGAAQVKARAEERLNGMFDILENALRQNAEQGKGPYLLGRDYSILDPYLLMLSRWTRNMKRPAKTLPYLAIYLEQVLARPTVRQTFEAEGLSAPYY
jgi:glutathione S-transferase